MAPPPFQLAANSELEDEEKQEAPAQRKAASGPSFADSDPPSDNASSEDVGMADTYRTGQEAYGDLDISDLQQRFAGDSAAQLKQAPASSTHAPIQRMVKVQTQKVKAPPPRAAKGPVAQRLAVQVQPDAAKENVIGDITVAGRPPRTFAGSMGDHTTAFAVHVQGIQNRLRGKSVMQAIRIMTTLVHQMQRLPGWEMIANLDAEDPHRQRLFAGFDALKKCPLVKFGREEMLDSEAEQDGIIEEMAASQADTSEDAKVEEEEAAMPPHFDSILLSDLQEYIHNYLEVRELIPLSTLNIREKSASGGKGKGEGRYIGVIRDCGKPDGPSLKDVKTAIFKMFDVSSVASVMVEHDVAALRGMAPGALPAAAAENNQTMSLIQKTWEQHLASLVSYFPQLAPIVAYADVKNRFKGGDAIGVVRHEAQVDLNKTIGLFERERAELQNLHGDWGKMGVGQLETFRQRKAEGNLDGVTGVEMYRAAQHHKAMFDEFLAQAEAMEKILRALPANESEPEYVPVVPILKQQHAATWASMSADLRDDAGVEAEEAVEDAKVEVSASSAAESGTDKPKKKKVRQSARFKPDPYADLVKSAKQHELTDAKEEELADVTYVSPNEKTGLEIVRGGFGVELRVDEAGKIVAANMDGRPLSPFKDTMGAHTIAWIVHLDHMRAHLIGKTVDEALKAVNEDVDKFVMDLAKDLEAVQATNAIQKEFGAVALASIQSRRAAVAGDKVPEPKAVFLQGYISELLSYTNMLPGITLNAQNTDGNGEPAARAALQEIDGEVKAFIGQVAEAKQDDEAAKLQAIRDGYGAGFDAKIALINQKIATLEEPRGPSQAVTRAYHRKMIEKIYPFVALALKAVPAVEVEAEPEQ